MKRSVSSDSLNSSIAAELHAGIVDLSDIGLLVLDADEIVVEWNTWLVNRSGISPEKAIGSTLNHLFPNFQNYRLLQTVSSALKYGLSAKLSQKLNPHILPLFSSEDDRRENRLMSQMVIVRPLNRQNCQCLVQIFDVSAAVNRDKFLRQQSAEHRAHDLHTRAILSSVAEGVITTDIRGNIDYSNAVAEQMTGWKPNEIEGRCLDDVFSIIEEQSSAPVIDPVQQVHKKWRSHHQHEQ